MGSIKWVVILMFFSALVPVRVFAQQVCQLEDPCAQYSSDPQKAADCYEQTVNACKSQSETLSSEVNYMNNQIRLTTLRINGTQTKISTLADEIDKLENEVNRLENILTTRLTLLVRRIPESYKRASTSQFGMLLFSKNFTDFIARVKYISAVQQDDAALIFQVKATQNNYNDRRELREEKKSQFVAVQRELERQNAQLAQQRQAKDSLLAETQGKEALYQQLLAQAKAQLAGFASFADSQGASVLTNQTACGDWGCYYNQRDSQWASALINGQGSGCNGPCSVLRVGCLVTSIAMMASHLGHRDVLPSDVAFSTPANFSVGTAMLRKGTIYVKGLSITRTTVSGSLNESALSGGPVIVGVNYGPFGTHFVVVKSYSDGKYIMNDPYVAGGHDINFTDYYSLGSVFEVDRVSI